MGGIGVGSDLTYSAVGGVNYRFNERFSLNVKYKALWVDYEEGDRSSKEYFQYDTVTHGFIVGFAIDL